MIRAGLLWLSEQPRIFKFVRSNRLARRFAARFVAGETVATAVAAVRDLNAHGVTASLDLLGESVASAAEAGHARDTYLESLAAIRAAGVDANVSVKLTQMGLDIDVRRDLQTKLRREGWRVRVYVPFGTHWYPYLMRRLAERPANIAFIVGNVVKESLRRR